VGFDVCVITHHCRVTQNNYLHVFAFLRMSYSYGRFLISKSNSVSERGADSKLHVTAFLQKYLSLF
jgi:hypothetical protein